VKLLDTEVPVFFTDRRDAMVSIPVLYLGGPEFESLPGGRMFSFRGFPQSLVKAMIVPKTCHDCFFRVVFN
jgi:hypothetical protein